MNQSRIRIFVNEREHSIAKGLTLGSIRKTFKPDADVMILNGTPADPRRRMRAGDRVILIKRGEIPGRDEIENLLTARHTPGVHARLKTATVAIAGVGGLGSNAAAALARMGIGHLILADFDLVEPSNLNRQAYLLEHIGLPKTRAMASLLERINPHVRVTAHQVTLDPSNLPTLFKPADVILECFDRAEAKLMLLETAAEQLAHAFLIVASGVAGYGDSNSIQTRRLGEKSFIVGDMTRGAEPGRGLMAPRVGIAACHQANLAVALLMDPDAARAEIPDVEDPVLG